MPGGAAEEGSWGGGGGTGGISTGGLGACGGPSRAGPGGPGVVAVLGGGLVVLAGAVRVSQGRGRRESEKGSTRI